MHQAVSVLGTSVVIKSELRTSRSLADAHGKPAADAVVGERGLVLPALGAPGVDANGGEIARLSFSAFGSRNHILGLLTGGIGNGIELDPGYHPPASGTDIIANRRRRIEFNESRKDPARNGEGWPSIRLGSSGG